MKAWIPLLFLAVILGFTVWLGRRSRGLVAMFWSQASAAGFDFPGDLPAALQKTRPYLSARRGSPPRQFEDTLLLVGSVAGAMISVGNGASVLTRSFLIGFLLPARLAFKDADLASLRKSHPPAASFEVLPDGSHLFLWGYTIIPSNLAKVLLALQDAIKISSPGPVSDSLPASAMETPAQAVTERRSLKGADLRRFYAAGSYASKDPAIQAYVKGFFCCEGDPTADDYDRAFLARAKAGFAWIKHPEAEPTHMTSRKLFELPSVPLPPNEDQRPLRHWKITAGMDCPDIKRGFSLSGVFGWPEEPKAGVLDKMVKLLAVDSLVQDDDSPEDAEYSYITDVRVVAAVEPLTHP